MKTIRELGAQERFLAFTAMLELRPHLGSLEEFVQIVNLEQRTEGYRLAGSFEEGEERAVAVGGVRTGANTALGDFLYVDDFGTPAAFCKRGQAASLLPLLGGEAGPPGR